MGKKRDVEIIRRFKERLARVMTLKKIILFGSRATGKVHKWSDFDLIIVSPNFKKEEFLDRGVKMYDYWDVNLPVDFLCYTPEEFNKLKKSATIVRNALKEGVEI